MKEKKEAPKKDESSAEMPIDPYDEMPPEPLKKREKK